MLLSPLGIASATLLAEMSNSERILRQTEQALNLSISDAFWRYNMAEIVDEFSVCFKVIDHL